MKKKLIFLGLLCPTLYISAQNTFPTSGSVGIGTTSPLEQLHITQNMFINGGNNGIRFQNGAGYSFWMYPSSTSILSIGGVGTAPTPGVININNSGNVGIGTTSPASKLHLLNLAQASSSGGTIIVGPVDGANLRLGYDADYSWIQGHGSKPLYINDVGNNLILNRTSGNVGIGTAAPAYKLDVSGTAYFSGSTISAGQITAMNGTRVKVTSGNGVQVTGAAGVAMRGVGTNTTAGYAAIQTAYDNVNYSCPLTLQDQGGNVLIGKTTQINTNYKLDVNGIVRANKLVVNTTGADFVFEKGYPLPSLDSVEKHINQYHHLPAIAPAADMQKNGVEVGESQTKLLQKIEELTLYIIEQNKKQEALSKKVEAQNELIQQLLQKVK